MAGLKKFDVIDVIEWSEDISYTLYHVAEKTWLRVWKDSRDNTYCYQLCIDVEDDVDLYELSDGYVNDEPTEANLNKWLSKFDVEKKTL